jgi:hypothetical protein
MSGTEESHASCSMDWPPWARRCGALSPSSEASAVVQRELGASLHRHEVEVLAMTVDAYSWCAEPAAEGASARSESEGGSVTARRRAGGSGARS